MLVSFSLEVFFGYLLDMIALLLILFGVCLIQA